MNLNFAYTQMIKGTVVLDRNNVKSTPVIGHLAPGHASPDIYASRHRPAGSPAACHGDGVTQWRTCQLAHGSSVQARVAAGLPAGHRCQATPINQAMPG
jgi:hypothetical protein